MNAYIKIMDNPVKVDLSKIDFAPYRKDMEDMGLDDDSFRGRVIFNFDDDLQKEDYPQHGIGFYCGPETCKGALSDQLDLGCNEKLEILFADLYQLGIEVLIGAAECYHVISYTDHLTYAELRNVITTRLERSGAVYKSVMEIWNDCEEYGS